MGANTESLDKRGDRTRTYLCALQSCSIRMSSSEDNAAARRGADAELEHIPRHRAMTAAPRRASAVAMPAAPAQSSVASPFAGRSLARARADGGGGGRWRLRAVQIPRSRCRCSLRVRTGTKRCPGCLLAWSDAKATGADCFRRGAARPRAVVPLLWHGTEGRRVQGAKTQPRRTAR